MKLLWLSALIGSMLMGVDAQAADAPAKAVKPKMAPNVPSYSLHTQMWEFPTGLRVLLQEDHTHPIVSVFTVVDHGFIDDPEGKEELAHFVEHIWFRTVHGDWPPVMDLVTSHTGLFNATTREDWTDYRTTMSSAHLEKLVALEGFRLSEPYRGVTADQLDVEREVIRNEWRRRNEQSYALLFDSINKYLYPADHPYHRSSTHESLSNIRLEDLQWYMDEFYKPAETTITLVGDFDPQEVMHYIFKHWDPKLLHPELTEQHQFLYPRPGIQNPDKNNEDHWYIGYWDPSAPGEKTLSVKPTERPPRVSADRREVPPVGSKEIGREKLPVDDTMVVLGWSLPGAYRDDHWQLMVLGNVTSAAIVGGLRQVYTEKEMGDRIGMGSGCSTNPQVENSTLLCFIELKDKKLDPVQVSEKALDQLATLWNPDYVMMFERWLQRGRNESLRDTLLSLDDVASVMSGRAQDIGIHAHYTGRATYHSEAMNQVVGIDSTEVAKLGFQYVKRDRAAVMIAEPLPASERDTRNASSSYAGANAEDELVETTDELVPDEVIASSYTHLDLTDMVDTRLDNGLRVVVLPHGEAPIVQASLLFGGGSASTPKGIYDFVSRFSDNADNDPLEIAGSFGFASWRDGWRISYKAPSGNLDAALWYLRQEVDALRPAMINKSGWLKGRRESLTRSWDSVGWHTSAARSEHLYPGSVTDAPTSWDDIETWKTWNAKTVGTYIDRHAQPGNAALIVVGNISPDEALKLAKQQFGGWKPTDGVPNEWVRLDEETAMPTAESKIQIFDDPKRTQTDVNMYCRLDYEGPHQQPAVEILGSILGDQTMRTVRVKEGLAYSPYATAYTRSDNTAMLMFSSLTVNKGVGRVVEFTRDAVKNIRDGGAPPAVVQSHKLKLANAGGVDAHSVSQVTGHLTWPIREGRDWTMLTEAGKHIAAVSPDTLDDLVQSCLDHALWQLVGPKDVIVPQLEEKGFAYEIVDWKAAGEALLWQYDPKLAKKKQKAKEKEEAEEATAETSNDDGSADTTEG